MKERKEVDNIIESKNSEYLNQTDNSKLENIIKQTKVNILIQNIILMVLSILLCLCFLGTISKVKYVYYLNSPERSNLESDIFDYYESTVNFLNNYNIETYKKDPVHEQHYTIKEYGDINLLNKYIANDSGNELNIYKVFISLILVTSLLMIILPMILFIISLINIFRFKQSSIYKRFFIIFFILSMIMVVFVKLVDFQLGIAIKLYITITFVGLITILRVEFRKTNLKTFVKKFNILVLTFIFFFATFAHYFIIEEISGCLVDFNKANYGSILSNIEYVNSSKVLETSEISQYLISLRKIDTSIFNFQYVIASLQLVAIILLLISFITELKNILYNNEKKSTSLYLWLAFIVYFIFTILSLINIEVVNSLYIKERYLRRVYKYTFNSQIAVLLFSISIYKSQINKQDNSLLYKK